MEHEERNSRGYPVDYLRCLSGEDARSYSLVDAFPAMVRGSGPIIADVELNALLMGDFDRSTYDGITAYLTGLADWIRGEGAPAGQEPVVRQYGTTGATVGTIYQAASRFTSLTDSQLHSEVIARQTYGRLPPFAPNRLFLIFTKGIAFDGHGTQWCGYHSAWADNAFYAYVPYPDVGGCGDDNPMASWQSVVSHEVMEAVTDPIPGSGWYAGDVQGEGGDGICAWHEVTMPFGTMQLFLDNRSQACSVWTPVAAPPPVAGDYEQGRAAAIVAMDQISIDVQAQVGDERAKIRTKAGRERKDNELKGAQRLATALGDKLGMGRP